LEDAVKGRLIFVHSVRQVFGNMAEALRVSGLLYVVQFAISVTLGLSAVKVLSAAGSDQTAAMGAMQTLFGPALIVAVVVIVFDLWIAVAWHRYVLLNEPGRGLLPALRAGRMAGYFGKGFLMVAILVLPALVVGQIGANLADALAPVAKGTEPGLMHVALSVLGQVAAQTIFGGLAFRLATVLAGVALAPGQGLFDGWAATAGETRALEGLAFLCAVCLAASDLFHTYVLPDSLTVQLAFGFFEQWAITMVGISILTTLYGHYIEKRPLV
jgi:hypothetical protein